MAQVNLNYRVTHIAQQDPNYCWACSLAMVLGRHSFHGAMEVVELCGQVSQDDSGALLGSSIVPAAQRVGLVATPVRTFDAPALARAMVHGPVAIFGRFNFSQGRHNHAMVVSAFQGDDQHPEAVQLIVHDPWEGSRWSGLFPAFHAGRSTDPLVRADYFVSRR